MDIAVARRLIDRTWEESIVPSLVEYIRIPNTSPLFDAGWQEHGHMDRAVALAEAWCRAQDVRGMTLEVVRLEGRTPLLYIEVAGASDRTVLLYGHLDKQPEMAGWRDGLGPWTPVIEGERLYGRGGADDGYAVFASLTAIRALQAQGVPHGRCVILIECCEESGSYDLPAYIDRLVPRIGRPELVVCLDSGCGNYEQLWCTTSLRGLVGGDLRVEVLTEGVHSGDAGGVVPCSFRILRQLLSRVEDEASGWVGPAGFHVEIPAERREQAEYAAQVLGESVYRRFPFPAGGGPVSTDPAELILNRTWRPALSVTGAQGLPPLKEAGNVLRPGTAVKLSLRLPPTCDAKAAGMELKRLLEGDPPHGARVRFEPQWGASGWNAPPLEPWLAHCVGQASQDWFGHPAVYMGEGGTIPFMGMLGERFPEAQFLITGVLGPQSNAHGPNEFLDLPTARRLTGCVAQVIAEHQRR
ncbi:MAG: peptidase M20 [Chromatiales bacterium 21-64-14]|nr:MAG: peptidase M20 [Chromatiales bacterium 21-64-14]HQU16464.1 M20 family metallopeptidase [Gammaproteobacteria bacterium]